jgi:hypothetical protein
MTVGWEGKKTRKRFPTLPTALGNRWGDFHIPTAPTPVPSSPKTKTERSSPLPSCFLQFRLILR